MHVACGRMAHEGKMIVVVVVGVGVGVAVVVVVVVVVELSFLKNNYC